jgi:hypothetical protein
MGGPPHIDKDIADGEAAPEPQTPETTIEPTKEPAPTAPAETTPQQ